VPGEPGLDLLYVDVAPVKENFSDHAAIFVQLRVDDRDLFAEEHLREILFGDLAEVLFGFRGIYPLKADFVGLVVFVQNGDGVAVADAYHFALDDDLYGIALRALRRGSLLRLRAQGNTDQHESQKETDAETIFHGCSPVRKPFPYRN
jgi:hypothetical protein